MRALLCFALLAHLLIVKVEARVPPTGGVYQIVAEIDRLSARTVLWDGFDPRRVPLEIYYGNTTYLFRHPNPPPEFVSLSSHQGVYAFAGRHESVTANAPAKLNGVWTATAMLAPDTKRTLTEQAALVIHETFHVFQREHHQDWRGDELELFVYPFEDTDALRLRRLETSALARAEAASAKNAAACWATAAIKLRRERFARLPAGSVAYERGTELNEGLAAYVEARAGGNVRRFYLPATEFAAGEVRLRAYKTGVALALLLDRFAPGWKHQLETGDRRPLDEMLEAALPSSHDAPCEFSPRDTETESKRAGLDVDALLAKRAAMRRDFLAQAGWKLIVVAGEGSPLFPQGFDPLNVERVGTREVLHTRFLKLGNAAGAIEILSRASLTEGAGAHPLFNGVRRLVVAGLAVEPMVEATNDRLTINAQGIKADFRGAKVSRAGAEIVVQLAGQPK